jgi:hypothetical protein
MIARMYRTTHATSPNPEEDFIKPSQPDKWTKTNDAANVGSFSAICLLFAKELSQRLGNKVVLMFCFLHLRHLIEKYE